MTEIGTKLHQAVESVHKRIATVKLNAEDLESYDIVLEFLDGARELPHYVLTEPVVDLICQDAAIDSVKAMFDAGIARLPFDQMFFELAVPWAHRFFVVVEHTDDPWAWDCAMTIMGNNGIMFPFMAIGTVRFTTRLPDRGKFPISRTTLTELTPEELKAYAERPEAYYWAFDMSLIGHLGPENGDVRSRANQQLAPQAALAVAAGLMASNVKGLERAEVSEHELRKLNKARSKRNAEPIPRHHLLRIGHVYNSKGERVPMTEADGRSTKVVLVAGHNKRQHYGPMRAQVKTIHVNAYLRNALPGEAAPVPMKVLVP